MKTAKGRGAWWLSWVTTIVLGWSSLGRADLVVFGDSFSDGGNVLERTKNLVLFPVIPDPSAGYFEGRFSNGPIWVDYLADRMSLPRATPSLRGGKNYAYGGARVLSDTLLAPKLSDLVAGVTSVSAADWVLVSGGPNDVWNAELDTTEAYTQLGVDVARVKAAAVETLIGRGAKNVLLAGIPDLTTTPITRGESPQILAGFDAAVEASTRESLLLLEKTRRDHPGVRLEFLDIAALERMWFADPARYGLTNITDPAAVLSTIPLLASSGLAGAPPLLPADQVNGYVFYDAVHPGTRAHAILADAAYEMIQVPEPVFGAGPFLWAVTLFVIRRRSSLRVQRPSTDDLLSVRG